MSETTTLFVWLPSPVVPLTVVFGALKLCGVIDWSWVWVLSPVWIVWGLALLFFGNFTLVLGLANRYDDHQVRKARTKRSQTTGGSR